MLSEEQKKIAIQLAHQGLAVQEIRKVIGVDAETFWQARERDAEFANIFSRARQEGLEEIADTLQNAHEMEDINRARLYSENMRWLLGKRKPHVYGDRMTVDLNQTVDLTGAIREARARALPSGFTESTLETNVIELPRLEAPSTTESASVAENADDIFS